MKVLRNNFELKTGRLLLLMALFSSSICVSGCGKEEAAPVKVAAVKKTTAPVQLAVATVKKAEIPYDPAGKRDPFKTFIESAKPERLVAPATPLQSYDLNALRLVGIMMLPGKKVAIVEDPTGKGYYVKEGTPIGMNKGIVVEILNDEVIVEERYLDETATTKKRKVSVKIPKEQGQGGEIR